VAENDRPLLILPAQTDIRAQQKVAEYERPLRLSQLKIVVRTKQKVAECDWPTCRIGMAVALALAPFISWP